MNFKKLSLIFLVIIIISLTFFNFTIDSRNKILDEKKLLHLKESSLPIIYKNGILFTYKGKGFNVYLSGSFVNWERMLKMKRSYFDVWYYFYTEGINKGDYSYKYNVDNFWILDPNNKDITRDVYDHPLSLLHIPTKMIFFQKSPIIEDGYKVVFWLNDISARSIYIYGDFNKWDPYQLPLEKEGNTWTISLTLRPGIYGYRFIIDYEKEILDPNNPKILENNFGEKCSIVEIK